MNPQVLPLSRLQLMSRGILESTDPGDVAVQLAAIMPFYHVVNYELAYDPPVFRGRKCKDANGFGTIGEVGCPPPALATAGRLNEAGRPLLYVSMNQFSVFEELDVSEGDYVHMALYCLKEATIRTAVLGEITHVHRWGNAMLGDTLGKVISEMLKRNRQDAMKSLIFTDAFLSSILRDKEASKLNYVRSRTLARLIFEKLPKIDGITYPSVALEGAMNMAIKPTCAQRLLKITRTYVVHIRRKYDYGIYDFDVVRWGKGHHGADGPIEWAQEVPPMPPHNQTDPEPQGLSNGVG